MIATLVLGILALIGAPLFAVIGFGALWGFYRGGTDLSVVAIEIYRMAETPILLAIPLFTFAGYLLGESDAPKRIVRLTRATLGWMPGGLAVISIAACSLFTAFTGASGVTIIALGALLYPALLHDGYEEGFSLGLVTTSGSLGLLFAPSLPLILYGIVTQQLNLGAPVSIDQLFLAGLLPGLLMIFLLGAWCFWTNRDRRVSFGELSLTELVAAARDAMWELPLPVIVLGGIYSGYFAVSEAAAVTAIYALVVEVFIQREVPLARLPEVARQSMVLVGGILIIFALSLASTTYMIDAGVPAKLVELVRSKVESPLYFLIALNVFLLALGAILDIFSALVLVVPLILPVALGYGVDPVHLGIIFLANMQIGYMTPPVGMNLFISSYRFGQPILKIYRTTLPFLLILLIAVLVITYWPGLSLVLIRP